MRAHPIAVAAVSAALGLTACGGSSSSSSSANSTRASSSPAAAAGTATSSSLSATASPSPAATHPRADARPRTSSATHDSGVRLPASFTVSAGRLSPPQISAPAHVAIVLTVRSGDGRTYQIALGTPAATRLTARPGAPARLLLSALANGSYAIEVDGHPRGQLVVGVDPGP